MIAQIDKDALVEAIGRSLKDAMQGEVDKQVRIAKDNMERAVREQAALIAVKLFSMRDFKMYQDKIVVEIVIDRKEVEAG